MKIQDHISFCATAISILAAVVYLTLTYANFENRLDSLERITNGMSDQMERLTVKIDDLYNMCSGSEIPYPRRPNGNAGQAVLKRESYIQKIDDEDIANG